MEIAALDIFVLEFPFGTALLIDGGAMQLPAGPGLGVEVMS